MNRGLRSKGVDASLWNAARTYAKAGWSVLPLEPRAKRPITRGGVHDATSDLDRVGQWWSEQPDANIGLAVPVGYLVVDLDSQEAAQALRSQSLTLPSTSRASTGRGSHLWYRADGARVRNAVALLPDVDVRAAGGYVVAPPSVHPTGATYRWIVPLDRSKISECPAWLLDRLAGRRPSRRSGPQGWYERIAAPVTEGRRNQALAEVAGLLFHRLPARAAAEFAYCWAQVKLVPALPDDEVARTIDSIAARELRQRRAA